MPTAGEKEEPWLDTDTKSLRMVSQYAGLSFNEVVDLDCYTFKVLLRDSFIEMMSNSEKGREYLEDAYYLTCLAPDKKSLRKHFGKGGNK